MKTLTNRLLLTLASLLFIACTEEETFSPVNVQFAFRTLLSSGSTGRGMEAIPKGSNLRISIENKNGVVVVAHHTVELLQLGELYITVPLALMKGDYTITDFMIVNEGEVVYATPKVNSPLASLVTQPLPIPFSVSKDNISNIPVEVVHAAAKAPEDFGYTSFDIEVISREILSLSVFVHHASGLLFSDADAFLLSGEDTLVKKSLLPTVNAIPLPSPDHAYTLVIAKDGYKKYVMEFKWKDLKAALQNKPFSVVLENAFTFNAMPGVSYEDGNYITTFQMYTTTNNAYRIDWGDGTTEVVNATEQYETISYYNLAHFYTKAGPYFVSITGNLSDITELRFAYDDGATNGISLQHLSELEVFIMTTTRTSKEIDFSHNPKLRDVGLSFTNIRALDLSHNPAIRYLGIDGNKFSTETLDAIVEHLYNTTIAYNKREGYLGWRHEWDPSVPIGPPSSKALAQMRVLVEQYDWTIIPVP